QRAEGEAAGPVVQVNEVLFAGGAKLMEEPVAGDDIQIAIRIDICGRYALSVVVPGSEHTSGRECWIGRVGYRRNRNSGQEGGKRQKCRKQHRERVDEPPSR